MSTANLASMQELPSKQSHESSGGSSTCGRSSVMKTLERLVTPQNEDTDGELNEINVYLSTKIKLAETPAQFWKQHQVSLPGLAKLAQQYLSTPAASISSKRAFSWAWQVYTGTRKSLSDKKADMLLFLRPNLKVLNFKH